MHPFSLGKTSSQSRTRLTITLVNIDGLRTEYLGFSLFKTTHANKTRKADQISSSSYNLFLGTMARIALMSWAHDSNTITVNQKLLVQMLAAYHTSYMLGNQESSRTTVKGRKFLGQLANNKPDYERSFIPSLISISLNCLTSGLNEWNGTYIWRFRSSCAY